MTSLAGPCCDRPGPAALHDALPVRRCPFSWSASQRLAQARRRAGQGLVNPARWHPGHQHLSVRPWLGNPSA